MRALTQSVATISLVFLGTASTFAAVPKKPPHTRYTELWTKSLFTNPPKPPAPEESPPNPLEDYTLASLCKIKRGWHVILLHKKDRTKRVRLTSFESSENGFRILSVDSPSSREARVEIDADGQRGWVEFERKFLAIRKATGARPSQPSARKNTSNPRGALTPPIPGNRPSNVRKRPAPLKK